MASQTGSLYGAATPAVAKAPATLGKVVEGGRSRPLFTPIIPPPPASPHPTAGVGRGPQGLKQIGSSFPFTHAKED
jgi:hypothetical protein